ncbi:MAG: AmmeMemoRadiSam system radical SAM enzyme [Phycisphaerales bacterium]|nr:MAG: AmmeMemoRadiSam system radical SAM enzyme [Phycisphaerales bacterium]
MHDLTRRAFLGTLSRCGLGACGFCAVAEWDLQRALAAERPESGPRREVEFFETLPGGAVRCGICPRHCVLNDGETGACRSRVNLGGRHYSRGYARPCIIRADPVEKIPLGHFLPGAETMTVAVGGCNLHCLYCQNWQHSQARPDKLKTFDLPPDEAVEAARQKGVKVIAFNYTDPVAFLEYAKDVAVAARKAELRIVAATGAYIEPEPLLDFAQYVDAITIGLKGFTNDFYETVCDAKLDGVLNSITTIANKTDCWLELVNLVVPTYNDDPATIREMVGWIRRNVGCETPLHFSRFVPMYRLTNLPRTPVTTLESACRIARDAGLKHVYTANIAPHDGANTYCHKCGASLIQRLGLKILENHIADGRCPKCRSPIPGVWK